MSLQIKLKDIDNGSEFWALPRCEFLRILERLTALDSLDRPPSLSLILGDSYGSIPTTTRRRRLVAKKVTSPVPVSRSSTLKRTSKVSTPRLMSDSTFPARLQPFEDDIRARLFSIVRRGNIIAAYRVKLHLAGVCESAFDAAFSRFRDITDRSNGGWQSTLAEALTGKGKYQSTRCAFFDEAALRDWCAFEHVDYVSGSGAAVKLVTSRKVLIELHCSLRVNMHRKLGNQFMCVLRATTGVWGADGSLQWSPTCDNVRDYVDRKAIIIDTLQTLFPTASTSVAQPNISFDCAPPFSEGHIDPDDFDLNIA